MKKLLPYLLSLLSGLLLFCVFPPLSLSIMAWVALIPLFAVLWQKPRPRHWKGHLKNGFYGYLAGLAFNATSFWWINEVSTLGYFPVILYLSLYPAAWAILTGGVFHPDRAPYPQGKLTKEERTAWTNRDIRKIIFPTLFASAAWICLEWLRGSGQLGFPWNYLGSGLPLSLAQPAEWVGAVGLSALPVSTAAILWCTGSRIASGVIQSGKRSIQWDFLFNMTLLCLLFLWGTWRTVSLNSYKDTVPLSTLIIQENTPQHIKWDRNKPNEIFSGYMESTIQAIEELEEKSIIKSMESDKPSRLHRPHWVIWPESSIPWPLRRWEESGQLIDPQSVTQINNEIWHSYSEEFGPFTLFSGLNEVFQSTETNEITRIYNSLLVFDSPSLEKKQTLYRKKHLVPFGEYIPFRESIPLFEKAFEFSFGSAMGANFSRGTATKPLTVTAGNKAIQVIPTICFEDTVPQLLRPFISTEKPQVILNVTNDGWFNHSWANEQHFRNARLRAIELRRPLIRAANTGISAIIGADGYTASVRYSDEGTRELRDKDGSPFIKGYLFGTIDLPAKPPLTLYAQWGDWFVIWCLLFIIFGILHPLLKRPASRGGVKDGIYTPAKNRSADKTTETKI